MLAWFLVGIPASSLVGGPVCGMLLQMDGIWGLAGWQWLFLLVSLPCIPLGFLTLRLLSDSPQAATWLNPDERNALDSVLASEVRERPPSSLLAALKDSRVLICAAIQFGFTLGSYGIGIWLPLMLKEYHLSNFAIGWIAAIPYLFASVGMILWARYVDERPAHRQSGGGVLVGRCRLAGAHHLRFGYCRRHRIQPGPGRRDVGAGDLLDHTDAIPDRGRRRRRARLHQQHRHRRRLCRPVHDGLAEGIFRVLRRRPVGGRGDHGRGDCGIDVVEAGDIEGVMRRDMSGEAYNPRS